MLYSKKKKREFPSPNLGSVSSKWSCVSAPFCFKKKRVTANNPKIADTQSLRFLSARNFCWLSIACLFAAFRFVSLFICLISSTALYKLCLLSYFYSLDFTSQKKKFVRGINPLKAKIYKKKKLQTGNKPDRSRVVLYSRYQAFISLPLHVSNLLTWSHAYNHALAYLHHSVIFALLALRYIGLEPSQPIPPSRQPN